MKVNILMACLSKYALALFFVFSIGLASCVENNTKTSSDIETTENAMNEPQDTFETNYDETWAVTKNAKESNAPVDDTSNVMDTLKKENDMRVTEENF